MRIELLDYTIRASLSSKTVAASVSDYADVAEGLVNAGVENVELGYLADEENWLVKPMTDKIVDYYSLVTNRNAEYSVMIHPSGYDVRKLPQCTGQVERIRVLLSKESKDAALEMIRDIINKGYKVICDIDRTYSYSDLELLKLLEEVNDFGVDQVTIIDDTKVMDGRPVQRVALIMDNNLADGVKIGLRSGENNGMAQYIVNIFLGAPLLGKRTVIIEGSLLGLGLISNNLCTECIADQLNADFQGHYDYGRLIDIISIHIPGVNNDPGNIGRYHPIFYLSTKNQVDGDYGRYFLAKGVMLHQVDDLLKQVAETERFEIYNESVAEAIYKKNIGKLREL